MSGLSCTLNIEYIFLIDFENERSLNPWSKLWLVVIFGTDFSPRRWNKSMRMGGVSRQFNLIFKQNSSEPFWLVLNFEADNFHQYIHHWLVFDIRYDFRIEFLIYLDSHSELFLYQLIFGQHKLVQLQHLGLVSLQPQNFYLYKLVQCWGQVSPLSAQSGWCRGKLSLKKRLFIQ